MGLKLKLNPNERLIVNGCILRNHGHRRLEIEIENRADVLRSSEMLDADGAKTPVSRLCYKVQIALVSPTERKKLLPEITERLCQLGSAMPSRREELAAIGELIGEGEFYAASRRLQALIPYEARLLEIAKGKAMPEEA